MTKQINGEKRVINYGDLSVEPIIQGQSPQDIMKCNRMRDMTFIDLIKYVRDNIQLMEQVLNWEENSFEFNGIKYMTVKRLATILNENKAMIHDFLRRYAVSFYDEDGVTKIGPKELKEHDELEFAPRGYIALTKHAVFRMCFLFERNVITKRIRQNVIVPKNFIKEIIKDAKEKQEVKKEKEEIKREKEQIEEATKEIGKLVKQAATI